LSVTCDRGWLSPGTQVSSTYKTDRHDITEILLKVALSTINQTIQNVEYVWYFSSLTGSQKPDLCWISSVYLSKLLILNKGSRIYITYYIYKKNQHFFTYTALCDKVCQWLATDEWLSPGTQVSSTYKTDRHDITEILLKVALNTLIAQVVVNPTTMRSRPRQPLFHL
jgi:hypothetical protein